MEIPEKVRVLGKDISVHIGSRDHDMRGYGNNGECDHRDLRIDIRSDLNHQKQEETLLHEILHCVSTALIEPDLTESQVKSLSSGLYAVLKDNNWWPK